MLRPDPGVKEVFSACFCVGYAFAKMQLTNNYLSVHL